jgi:predicted nucleotidyltransferase component of viral defense system
LVSPLTSMQDIPVQVASQIDLALMKLVAINQRGSCKDFIDLKALIEQNRYRFEFLLEKLKNKFEIGEEMQLQLKKSLVYFDDAEKDLNIQMYNEGKQAFETLENEEWERTKAFFERFVLKR